MVKIIKQGKSIQPVVFNCGVCDCEFEASISDCIAGYRCDDGYAGTIKCPCCGTKVSQFFPMKEDD